MRPRKPDGLVRQMVGLPFYIGMVVAGWTHSRCTEALSRLAPSWTKSILDGVIADLMESGVAADDARTIVFGIIKSETAANKQSED